MTLIETTPWVASGLVYETYKKNWGTPRTSVVLHAPTRLMREDEHILAIVDREYERDPDNAAVEYGAEWVSSGGSSFLSLEEIEGALGDAPLLKNSGGRSDDPRNLLLPPGGRIAAAVDLGFVKNSAVLVVVVKPPEGQIRVVYVEERRPAADSPLVPSEVCSDFATTMAALGCTLAASDGHYMETLREHTLAAGIALYPGAPPAERFLKLRTLLREKNLSIRVPALLRERVRRQALGITSRNTPGGGISLQLRRELDGSHGDVIDCIARAVHAITVHGGALIPGAPEGTREYHPLEREMEQRLRRREEIWWLGERERDHGSTVVQIRQKRPPRGGVRLGAGGAGCGDPAHP